MARRIIVELIADTSKLEKGFRDSAKAGQKWQASITGLGRSLKTAGAAAGAALGAREIVQGLGSAVNAASDLNEQANRSRVIFKQSAASIEAWSKTTADGFGLAQREALAAAGNFGSMLRTAGVATDEAARMSRALVELAADMASFNNQDPSEMLDRLRSGLAGEAEPLRRFGVFLSEAAVQQEAYRQGIAKTGTKLSEQQKVLGRYRLILKQTADQQGDFARTSDSLANQQRILNANWDEAKAELGQRLLPVMLEFVRELNEFIDELGEASRRVKRFFLEMAADAVNALENVVSVLTHAPARFGGDWARGIQKQLRAAAEELEHDARSIGQNYGKQFSLGFQGGLEEHLQANRIRAAVDESVTGGGPERRGATAEQRNAWFDAMIGRRRDMVQDVKSLGGQIAALRAIAQLIRERLRLTKDVTRRMTLEDLLLDVQRQIRGAQEASKARTEQAAAEREQLEKERRERERLARQTRLFRDLGLGPGGADLAPGVAALQRRFSRIAKQIAGTSLAAKFRTQMRGIRKVLSDEFTKTDKELRDKIEQMLANIDNKLKDHAEKRGRFRAFNVNQMLAGLGLSPDEVRALRGRLAQVGPGGTVPGKGTGAFGMVPVVVNHQTIVDGRVVESSVTKRQQNRRRRNPPQKRGPYAGALG